MNNNYFPGEFELIPEFETIATGYGQRRFSGNEGFENEYENTPPTARPTSQSIYETDLNAPCFAGNFNFRYDGNANKALATFNTDVSFKNGVPPAEKGNIMGRLTQAAAYWNNAATVEIKDINGNYSHRVDLGFELKPLLTTKYSNKRTSVHPDNSKAIFYMEKNREVVSLEMHIFASSTPLEIAHELGHIWGLKDEYPDSGKIGWITMKLSPCHVGTGSPFLKDTNAIMNGGNEFRTRYFTHFGKAILNSFWSMPNYIIPVKLNGQTVARTIQGRIRLLKKTATGGVPGNFGPLNPQFGLLQVAKR
jgi:hypothetical protein